MHSLSLKSKGRTDSERSLISPSYEGNRGRERMQDSKNTRSSTFDSEYDESPTATKSLHDIPLRKIRFLGGPRKSDALPYQSIEINAVGKEGDLRGGNEPKRTVTWRGSSFWWLVGDICGIIIALCFLALGGCVVNLQGKEETSWTVKVIQATKIGPSIWPILFSGILGSAIRAFADWRAEHGVTLMNLEKLMGSLTMASSLIANLRWPGAPVLSLTLIALWSFNPLGSQALFRGAYLQAQTGSATQFTAIYLNPSLVENLQSASMFNDERDRHRSQVRALYTTTFYDIATRTQYLDYELLGDEQIAASRPVQMFYDIILALPLVDPGIKSAVDPWDNVRIPHLEYLPAYDDDDPHRWVHIDWRQQPQNWSSLIGDVVRIGSTYSRPGNTTFNITSSYQKFNCGESTEFESRDKVDAWALETFGSNASSLLKSSSTDSSPGYESGAFIFMPPQDENATAHPSLYFLLSDTLGSYEATKCSLSTTYVDASVQCLTKNAGYKTRPICGVEAIRKCLNPPTPEGYSILDRHVPNKCDGTNCGDPATWHQRDDQTIKVFHDAFNTFLDDDDPSGRMNSSTLSRFMRDPVTSVAGDNVEPITLRPERDLVERRLSLLYNTLWKAGWAHRATMTGKVLDALEQDDEDAEPLPEEENLLESPLVFYFDTYRYALDYPWIVTYFFAVFLMLGAAVFTLVMHWICQAPPILGFVSTLLRDSKYYDDPKANSTEDGPQRTKRLGSVRVQIADVQGEQDVGKIAFAPAHEGLRVRKGRVYE